MLAEFDINDTFWPTIEIVILHIEKLRTFPLNPNIHSLYLQSMFQDFFDVSLER